MRLGSEVLLASNRLRGLRVGVVANPASIDNDYRHIVDRVAAADGVTRTVRSSEPLGQSPYDVAAFMEMKTVWHPIGK